MFLAVSITPILTVIPAKLSDGNSSSAVISIVLSLAALIPLAFIIGIFMQAYPHHNFYEILIELFGEAVAKVIIAFYGIWAFVVLSTKVWQYAINLQSSIMANTKEQIFFVVMILLVLYAFSKGVKTIFRISEFILIPMLIVLILYILSALPSIRMDYVRAANTMTFSELCNQAGYVIAAGGNLFLLLIYGDSVKDRSESNKLVARFLAMTVIVFAVLLLVVTVVSFGVVGNYAAESMAAPFYVAMKGISVLNILENFEAILIIITFLSDFLGICLYASIAIRCIKWVCSVRKMNFLYIPFAIFIYYLAFILCRTQFDVEFFYTQFIVKWNMIMQYLIPFILIIVYYGRVGFKQRTAA